MRRTTPIRQLAAGLVAGVQPGAGLTAGAQGGDRSKAVQYDELRESVKRQDSAIGPAKERNEE